MAFAAMAGVLCFLGVQTSGTPAALSFVAAALLCQCRQLCNLFDGMLAVEAGRHSPDGTAWNEFPDRHADMFIFIGIGYRVGLPSLGWTNAYFAVLTAYTRELGNAVGSGGYFSGPMAKQHRMAIVTGCALLSAFVSGFKLIGGVGSDFEAPIAVSIAGLSTVCAGALFTAVLRANRLIRRLNAARTRDGFTQDGFTGEPQRKKGRQPCPRLPSTKNHVNANPNLRSFGIRLRN